jgi:hypothetical protein
MAIAIAFRNEIKVLMVAGYDFMVLVRKKSRGG